MTERDIESIATYDRDEPEPCKSDVPQPYVCCDCKWTGRGATAYVHRQRTGHEIRGKHWPVTWGNAQWSRR